MSKIWTGLRAGLKFSCTACGKCCSNKRSNVSVNLSEVDSMSEFMGMDKLSFLDKYTEEKEIDGQIFTKLKHKADLSCALLDIETVIGEAEWKSEAKRCEGIIIDSFLTSPLNPTPQSSLSAADTDASSVTDTDESVENILYDGVIKDFESTFHGNLSSYFKSGETAPTAQNNPHEFSTTYNIVHPDTIIRQMILHEIHADGMGPDWGYQDSLELLLESEQNSLETSEGNVLEDFKTEFCEKNFSTILHEDSFLRVVDTTTPTQTLPELLFSVHEGLNGEIADSDYKYDLYDLNHDLGVSGADDSLDSDAVTVTKRRFEFLNSSSLVQTEIILQNMDTPGLSGGHFDRPAVDRNQLVMPIHQVISILCKKIISNLIAKSSDNSSGEIKMAENSRNSEVIFSVIGAGGFALPSHLLALYPSLPSSHTLSIDAVEPEKRVLTVAKDFFGANFTVAADMKNENKNSENENSTRIIAHATDGLSYLQEFHYENKFKNEKKIDFLIIDAFEETPPQGFGPLGAFSNRAPPLSILSDPTMLVNSLKSCNLENVSVKNGEKLLGNIIPEGGGVLAVNLFGPKDWVEKVYGIFDSCPGLSKPVLLRIKGQKNILLVTSRISK